MGGFDPPMLGIHSGLCPFPKEHIDIDFYSLGGGGGIIKRVHNIMHVTFMIISVYFYPSDM